MVSEKNEYTSIPADELNLSSVRNIVNKDAHPHPVLLVIIVIMLMIMFYYLYVAYGKPCINGKWVSSSGEVLYVEHNKWNDTIQVNEDIRGYIIGNAIYLQIRGKTSLGILYDNSIYWLHGSDEWRRPISV